MIKKAPKAGDPVRATIEGTASNPSSEGGFWVHSADGLHKCFIQPYAEGMTYEILAPEPKPGEAWLVRDERTGETFEAMHRSARGRPELTWTNGAWKLPGQYIIPIRRLVDPGEDA